MSFYAGSNVATWNSICDDDSYDHEETITITVTITRSDDNHNENRRLFNPLVKCK